MILCVLCLSHAPHVDGAKRSYVCTSFACSDPDSPQRNHSYFDADDLDPKIFPVRLDSDKALGEARYVPRTDAEVMGAIFTFWNILDSVRASPPFTMPSTMCLPVLDLRAHLRVCGGSLPVRLCAAQLMWEKSRLVREANSTEPPVGRAHLWQSGYVREVQVRRMVQLIRQARLLAPGYGAHYCEIGMKCVALNICHRTALGTLRDHSSPRLYLIFTGYKSVAAT